METVGFQEIDRTWYPFRIRYDLIVTSIDDLRV